MSRKIVIDEVLAMKLYQSGLNDVEIGQRIHVSTGTVANWRKRNHLPTRYRQKIPYKPPTMSKLVHDSVMARKVGLSYGEYKCYGG